ncbi:MAG TPA: prepilin-type N-terminal cleavage/methylation domain-containing protein [Verrucomicrobiales bacterium]|jgi:prepilin-type N-terminal cleavage/methylation domain-containing protein|nr:prepilin-type N-terminal cleavage/methylation domain-containing protein [Verrucomicrobiales bacterium]
MKLSLNSRPVRASGFTLIELLVVITIIALLVTGAFGAYGFVMERAKKSEAQGACMTVFNAIDQYNNQYDYLPQPMSATKNTDCKTDTSAEEGLIWILLGKDETQNSRKTNFLGDLKDAKTNAEKKVSGIVRNDDSAALYDPWGNYYKVTIDLDLNEKLDNPNEEEVNSGVTELHKKVIVYSVGKDMKEETWKDNVTSWSAQ